MSGSTGANLPVRIEVQGTQQAEAQFNQVGAAGQRAMQRVSQSTDAAGASTGRFGQIVGQAGFQIGDFASQVQAGGSALTALSQQGAQFLGAFGVGGAVAGAALTVGILAAQFLTAGQSSADAARLAEQGFDGIRRSSEDLKKAIEEINDLFLTQEQRATAARNAVIQNLNARLAQQEDTARQFLDESASQAPAAERDLAAARRRLDIAEREAANARRAGTMVPQDQLDQAREGIFRAQARLDALNADVARQSRILGEVRAQRERLGEAPAEPPREERLERLGRPERPGLDVAAAAQQTLDELTRSYDAYNQALNLSAAGLERAAPALRAYAEQQALLGQLLDAGIISEAEFTAEVERSSEALANQIQQIETRAERSSQMGNQLGFTFQSAFEDAILKGQSFSAVLKGIEQDIARIIIRSAITQPLGNAISSVVSAGMSSFFSAPSAPVSGARATGGPVFPGGTYLVGERGPELLTMGGAGHVTPNAGGIVHAPTYHIDARGADAGIVPRLRAEMVAVARAANAELLAEIQRGGRAASIVGRR